jgi:hypothetical protein
MDAKEENNKTSLHHLDIRKNNDEVVLTFLRYVIDSLFLLIDPT